MRQLFTLLFILAFTAGVSAQNWGKSKRIKGNGDVKTETRDVSSFSGIQACCSFKVEVRKGSPGVKVEAESNLIEYVKTEVSGGRLSIGFTGNVNISNQRPIRVYVSMNDLDYVKASSSSKIAFKDAFRGDDLQVRVSSSADILDLDFTGNEIRLDASSSGTIELAGSGSSIRAKSSSSSRIRASECRVKRARAAASSSGSIRLNVTERLDADASSGASIRYVGSPSVDSDTSSGGSVRSGN
ncbi:MAG: head GIN domain-containing protein [Bacteroidota bacterium]